TVVAARDGPPRELARLGDPRSTLEGRGEESCTRCAQVARPTRPVRAVKEREGSGGRAARWRAAGWRLFGVVHTELVHQEGEGVGCLVDDGGEGAAHAVADVFAGAQEDRVARGAGGLEARGHLARVVGV